MDQSKAALKVTLIGLLSIFGLFCLIPTFLVSVFAFVYREQNLLVLILPFIPIFIFGLPIWLIIKEKPPTLLQAIIWGIVLIYGYSLASEFSNFSNFFPHPKKVISHSPPKPSLIQLLDSEFPIDTDISAALKRLIPLGMKREYAFIYLRKNKFKITCKKPEDCIAEFNDSQEECIKKYRIFLTFENQQLKDMKGSRKLVCSTSHEL